MRIQLSLLFLRFSSVNVMLPAKLLEHWKAPAAVQYSHSIRVARYASRFECYKEKKSIRIPCGSFSQLYFWYIFAELFIANMNCTNSGNVFLKNALNHIENNVSAQKLARHVAIVKSKMSWWYSLAQLSRWPFPWSELWILNFQQLRSWHACGKDVWVVLCEGIEFILIILQHINAFIYDFICRSSCMDS